MVDEPDAAPLTAADVKALRAAEGVTFHHTRGESFIRATLNSPVSGEPRVFTASQQRLFPDASGADRARTVRCRAVIADYAELDRSRRQDDLLRSDCYVYGSPGRDTWRTVLDLLRAGDCLMLCWVAGNNNGYLDEAALYSDELFVVIRRGQRRWTFLVAHSVCPANTARMIRR